MSGLTREQQEACTLFGEICNVQDQALCARIMNNNNYSVDAAVNNFLAGGGNEGYNQAPAPASAPASSSSNAGGSSSSGGITRRSTGGGSAADQPPSAATTASARDDDSAVPARNALLDALLRPLRWLLTPSQASINPDADARRFVDNFSQTYGDTHPRFYAGAYAGAVRQAFQQGKYLLVYLHSAMHQDTDAFCRNTLCNEVVKQTCDAGVVSWAASLQDVEGYMLSLQLQSQSYPFCALLVCNSEREVTIADRMQGGITGAALLERLRHVQMVFQAQLQERQQEQRRRAESISLREEQDRDFRESELADRLRREQREQEEQRVRDEASAEKERGQAASDKLQRKRESIAAEPAAGGADVTTLRLQLPSGQKINRRFLQQTKVQQLCDWLDVHFADDDAISTVNFSLSTAFPKTELADMSASLHSYGLHPKAVLYVQDLDT